jgi:hypothetical protein
MSDSTDLFDPLTHYVGARPPLPPDFIEQDGYRLPLAEARRQRDLLGVAAANGRWLTADLLHKWRLWRFVPAPVPGGPTGHGPGKGETWPPDAGWRVAYISRWLTDRFTYDVIRVALWPYTPELNTQRIDAVLASLRATVRRDNIFHHAVLDIGKDAGPDEIRSRFADAPASLRRYVDAVLLGDACTRTLKALWEAEGLQGPPPKWFGCINLPDLLDTVDRLTPTQLQAFMERQFPWFQTDDVRAAFRRNAVRFYRLLVVHLVFDAAPPRALRP